MGEMMVTRTLTEKEWRELKRSLPRLKWLEEIEYVKQCCYSCAHLSAANYCRLHEVDVPIDQRGKDQGDCWEQSIIPF